ncbi:CocE/NonD family hydrolase [Nocardioides sp. WG-D5]
MHTIEIEVDVPVPMRDGTILRADIYRPAEEGSYPVLVNRSPYDKNMLLDLFIDFKRAARSGYVVIYQDTRGRFASDGEWTPWKHERDDGYDTVEWAASLPYGNGKVGMFGASYHGSTQWSAAIAGSPQLRAIAPVITWSDPEDGLMFRGGAIELGVNALWGHMTALGQHPKEGLAPDEMMQRVQSTFRGLDSLATSTYWQLPSGLPAIAATGQPDLGVTRALADPLTTDECRVSTHYDAMSLPSLNFAGWNDLFLQGTLDNFVGMRERGHTARLIVGPWTHGTIAGTQGGQVNDTNYGLGAMVPGGQAVGDIHLAWFDHWLKDQPATKDHESGVLLFVMGINQWREEGEWPLSRAKDTELYLDVEGSLNWSNSVADDASSSFVYDPADPVITRGGNMLLSTEFPAGPLDQRETEERDDVLVFTTEPLEDDLEITGRVRATLFASTDGPSTDWIVRLCEVDSAGVSRNIVDGITRVHTDAHRVDEVEIDLWSTSIVIRAGHRLRVQVTSSNFPRWDRNLNTDEPVGEQITIRVARQRIFHDRSRPSRIILPIVAS